MRNVLPGPAARAFDPVFLFITLPPCKRIAAFFRPIGDLPEFPEQQGEQLGAGGCVERQPSAVCIDKGKRARSTERTGMAHKMVEELVEQPVPQFAGADARANPGPNGPEPRDRGLLAIAIFKLSKTVFFFSLGLGIVHLMHKDVGEEVLRLATSLRFDPEGSFVTLLMSKVDAVDAHKLLELGVASFAYSAVALVEGTGLLLQKVWAEFFTLGLTILFLPWEGYELIKEATLVRVCLLLTNLAVLAYLVWLLRKRGRL